MKISMFLKSVGSKLAIAAILITLFLQFGVASAFADSMTRTVQEALVEKGFDPGPIDGIWGPRTKAAVVQFQESAGLTANGEIDDQTKSGLLASVSAPISSPASSGSMPTTPAFSEDDTGPDATDGDIAWGRHKS